MINEFLDYFVTNWMDNKEINDINRWNGNNSRYRTTNPLEVQNNKLKFMF